MTALSRSRRSLLFVPLLALALVLVGGCNRPNKTLQEAVILGSGSGGQTVGENDVNSLVAAMPRLPYLLAPGDEIDVRVLEDDRMDGAFKIDIDGRFQFPYAGSVKAEGLTTIDIREKLSQRLGEYYVEPHVSVNLTSYEQQYVNVLGYVNKPGRIALRRDMTLIDAITEAGGPHPDADTKRMVLVRRVSQDRPPYIAAGIFNYHEAMLNPLESGAWTSNILLQRGDTLMIAKSGKAQWMTLFNNISTVFNSVTDVERGIILYPNVEDVFNFGRQQRDTTIIVR
ncbi:MAG: polysaccharide export protein [Planctomycetes bacterium]|nr:polysaccharide export protein [Planctomycetota bacterium]